VNANDVKAVRPRPPEPRIDVGEDAVLVNHRMRSGPDGWECMFCETTDPAAGPCVPRRWGDQPSTSGRPRGLPPR
jgi:hypothetical protein